MFKQINFSLEIIDPENQTQEMVNKAFEDNMDNFKFIRIDLQTLAMAEIIASTHPDLFDLIDDGLLTQELCQNFRDCQSHQYFHKIPVKFHKLFNIKN